MRKPVASLITLALVAPVAAAGPLAREQHSPAMFLDEPQTSVFLQSRDKGYSFTVATRISGANAEHDRARVDWKQGGKVVATAACDLTFYPQARANAVCRSDSDQITAKGPVEAELIYTDDQDGKDYLVRTFALNVHELDEGRGTKQWQIFPDDALGIAWVRHTRADTAERMMPLVEFWMATAKTPGRANMRCTVDGKRIDDIDASIEPLHLGEVELEQEADHFTGKEHEVYHYEGHSLDWNVVFGPKSDDTRSFEGHRMFLVDHPGKWDCLLRDGATGKTVREFLFTVNDQGMVEQNEIQQGKRAVPTLPNVAMIEVRIPKDAGLGERIRPDLMKKSLGFGLAWPEHPHVKAIQAAYPAASGLTRP